MHYKKPFQDLSKGRIKFCPCDLASQSFNKRIEYFEYNWFGNTQNGKPNFANSGPDGRIHPTQKPIALYKWLLDKYTNEGDLILDTHLGSMSIAIACHYMNRGLVGYEIDRDYFEAGVKRFRQQTAQTTLDL